MKGTIFTSLVMALVYSATLATEIFVDGDYTGTSETGGTLTPFKTVEAGVAAIRDTGDIVSIRATASSSTYAVSSVTIPVISGGGTSTIRSDPNHTNGITATLTTASGSTTMFSHSNSEDQNQYVVLSDLSFKINDWAGTSLFEGSATTGKPEVSLKGENLNFDYSNAGAMATATQHQTFSGSYNDLTITSTTVESFKASSETAYFTHSSTIASFNGTGISFIGGVDSEGALLALQNLGTLTLDDISVESPSSTSSFTSSMAALISTEFLNEAEISNVSVTNTALNNDEPSVYLAVLSLGLSSNAGVISVDDVSVDGMGDDNFHVVYCRESQNGRRRATSAVDRISVSNINLIVPSTGLTAQAGIIYLLGSLTVRDVSVDNCSYTGSTFGQAADLFKFYSRIEDSLTITNIQVVGSDSSTSSSNPNVNLVYISTESFALLTITNTTVSDFDGQYLFYLDTSSSSPHNIANTSVSGGHVFGLVHTERELTLSDTNINGLDVALVLLSADQGSYVKVAVTGLDIEDLAFANNSAGLVLCQNSAAFNITDPIMFDTTLLDLLTVSVNNVTRTRSIFVAQTSATMEVEFMVSGESCDAPPLSDSFAEDDLTSTSGTSTVTLSVTDGRTCSNNGGGDDDDNGDAESPASRVASMAAVVLALAVVLF